MTWSNWCIILLASYLFAVANGGHPEDSHPIQRVGFSGDPFSRSIEEQIEEWYPTKYKIKRYSYLWNITDCSDLLMQDKVLLFSPTFPKATADGDFKWSIVLSSNGANEQTRNNLSVYFILKDWYGSLDLRARYRFSILDEQGNHRKERASGAPERFESNSYRWGFNGYILKDILLDASNGLLTSDKLSIHCEIHIFINMQEYSDRAGQLEAPQDQLANHLEQLYESLKFTDVTISVGGQQFKAHKAILAARSPVFKAMFSHNMREYQRNHLEVVDIHPVVFQEVLRYIYTGRVSLVEEDGTLIDKEEIQQAEGQLLVGLLMASDKYQLDGLGSICEQVLTRAISLESAGELLVLAETYNRPQLKNKVDEFRRVNDYNFQLNGADNWMENFNEAPTE